MGIWGAVKYALNSTLGTSGFKPLNQLLTDDITAHVENYIGKASKQKEKLFTVGVRLQRSDVASYTPMLDISNSGGGYIYGISYGENSSSYGVTNAGVKIEIDGETFYDKIFNSCQRRDILIDDFVDLYYNGSTTYGTLKLPPLNQSTTMQDLRLINNTVESGKIMPFWFDSSIPFPTYTSGNNREIVEIMSKPIRFNESVKISVKGQSTYSGRDTYGGVIYSLDE